MPSDGANAPMEKIRPFVEYLEIQAIHALKLAIKAGKGESVEEDGDWSKKLQIKLRETNLKPAISLEQKQQVIANSFYKVVKAIDNAFRPFEKYFAIVERPPYLKTLEDIKTRSMKGVAGMGYTAKYQIYYNKPSFSYEVRCKLTEENYLIYIEINKQKQEYTKSYTDFLSIVEINEFVEFAGKNLMEFVDANMLGSNE
jgi:hypothetical protein